MPLPRVIFELLIAALVVWRVSTTLAIAKVFEPLREWARPEDGGRRQRGRAWVYELVSCQFCLSHYVAAAYVYFWRVELLATGGRAANLIVTWLAVVALSSILARLCQKREPVIPDTLAAPLREYLNRSALPDEETQSERLLDGGRAELRFHPHRR